MKIKAVVEIPKGSCYKYEVNKCGKMLRLDRPLNQDIPNNYGYVPNTMCADGDPLDVFVIAKQPLVPLAEVEAEIIGVLKCTDNGVQDDKLICLLAGEDSPLFLPYEVSKIVDYLNSYKEGFTVDKEDNQGYAIQTYQLSRVWENPAD